MHSARAGRGRDSAFHEINVTPLVDVMLVLLIIFMIAAPMITAGVPVDLPNAQGEPLDHHREEALITVLRDGRVLLFREELSLEELEAHLETDPRVHGREEVYLQADESVSYGEVVRVLALVRRSGVARVGLVTDPSEGATADSGAREGAQPSGGGT